MYPRSHRPLPFARRIDQDRQTIVPSSALDSMNLGAMGGLISLSKTNEAPPLARAVNEPPAKPD